MKNILVVIVLCVISGLAMADLIVVKDYGGKPTNFPTEAQLSAQRDAFKREQTQTQFIPKAPALFPIESTVLSVGMIDRHEHHKSVHSNFFILGADNESVKWLRANKSQLQTMNAKGFVTNVKNANDFGVLKKIADPIPLDAVNVDQLATVFNLRHYPVLVTPKEVIQ